MNKAIQAKFEAWLQDPVIDEETKAELRSIAGNTEEMEDRFYRELEFGTGGLRGVVGAGTNRMNRYTVGKASQGLAQYILRKVADEKVAEKAAEKAAEKVADKNAAAEKVNGAGSSESEPSAVIAYDSRHKSPEFALETALVFAANGIKAYLFESLRPTPQLSFAVRDLGATAGVVITASHNPPQYNGYKAYGQDGGQLVPDAAEQVIAEVQSLTSFADVHTISEADALAAGKLVRIGAEADRRYIEAVTNVSPNRAKLPAWADQYKIVFTPLHGSGHIPVRTALAELGFSQVHVVPEQAQPDPDFSTVASPNPEEEAAFTIARKHAKQLNADMIIGTDPDCDRMGAAVKNSSGEYEVLTGNESGAIMLYYLLSQLKAQGKLPTNGAVIKTIVTSELGAEICRSFGVEILNTLTGFKFIAEKMKEFEQSGAKQFLFGYEESYGYLAGTYARDKDAVVAATLISEAGAYYKAQGKTLFDVLAELYEQYGVHKETLCSLTMEGKSGMENMRSIMQQWRNDPPAQIGSLQVVEVLDYANGLAGLPPENALKYKLENEAWLCLRPSGTEPKIKVYIAVRGTSEQQCNELLQQLEQDVMAKVKA